MSLSPKLCQSQLICQITASYLAYIFILIVRLYFTGTFILDELQEQERS